MLFKVIENCYQNAGSYNDPKADFLLESDWWNDYSYRTMYHLHATSKLTGVGTRYLGSIKIMKKGQTQGDYNLLRSLYEETDYFFSMLPDDFVSVSFSLELFQSVVQLLESKDAKQEFARALRLLFDADDPRYLEYEKEDCFRFSLLRDATIDNYILKKGKQLLLGEAVFYDLEKKTITVKYKKASSPIVLDFNPIPDTDTVNTVPYGIIAFIGQNGCGKSTFLYQMAKLLYLSPSERFLMKDIVDIDPSDVGVFKLFMFSYSAFDNFMFPGNTIADYRLMAEGVKNRDGRFVYCGVRDIEKEINNLIDKTIEEDKERSKDGTPILVERERVPHIYVKSVEELADEFEKALKRIDSKQDIKHQWELLGHECEEILPEVYKGVESMFSYDPFSGIDYAEEFLHLSTGIKFFLHTMSHIYAYCEDNSLLLFDEPENHLHPPMLSFMINQIRKAIRNTHSVMLIATHSPVILQELFSSNIYVVRRNGDEISLRHPETETYGENFGYINNLVFRLNSDVSTFHDSFEKLFVKWGCSSCDSIEEVIDTFRRRLQCEKLSSQMEAYLVNLYGNPEID